MTDEIFLCLLDDKTVVPARYDQEKDLCIQVLMAYPKNSNAPIVQTLISPFPPSRVVGFALLQEYQASDGIIEIDRFRKDVLERQVANYCWSGFFDHLHRVIKKVEEEENEEKH